jgi:hypothetical protein
LVPGGTALICVVTLMKPVVERRDCALTGTACGMLLALEHHPCISRTTIDLIRLFISHNSSNPAFYFILLTSPCLWFAAVLQLRSSTCDMNRTETRAAVSHHLAGRSTGAGLDERLRGRTLLKPRRHQARRRVWPRFRLGVSRLGRARGRVRARSMGRSYRRTSTSSIMTRVCSTRRLRSSHLSRHLNP